MAVKNTRMGRTQRGAAKPAAPRVPEAIKPVTAKPVVADTQAGSPVDAAAPSKMEVAVAKTGAAVEALAAPVRQTAEKVAEVAVKAVETVKADISPGHDETADTAISQVTETVQKETEKMNTEATQTFEAATDKGQAVFADMNQRAQSAMEKNAKLVEEMNELAKGNVEAMVESTRIATKGFESLSQEAAEYGRKSFEQASATVKNMAQVKSPTDLFKLQSDYVRSAFDMYVAEASKTTEHMMKLAGDAAQPLSNRMAVAAEKVKVVA